jgi:Ca2+-binding RTX toxin-like protein
MAIRSRFIPGIGLLDTFGDSLDNNVVISRNAAGQILINGGAVQVLGGTPTVANTSVIQMFGLGGNDVITLNETNGALPAAHIFGGAGNDTITGGSGGDQLFGESGNDTILGRGGNDLIFGGAGNDTLTGGDGDDQIFGQGGNDRMIWNPGDDTDLFEGGAGLDTAEVNGGNGTEHFTVTANGSRVRFDRVDPAPFSLDLGTTENLVVNMNGGDDTFSATGNLSPLISITVDGGAGNDTILGGNGADTLRGGDGNDFIDGNQGNDTAFLGAGDDVFQWDPGDGSDIVEGQDGIDTMLFNGSNINETMDLSANGERVRLTRNVASIVMDLNEVEHVTINALGGADTVYVNDLSGTDETQVDVNLAGAIGGTTGDGAADNVRVNGTNGGDHIDIVGAGTSVSVLGLAARVNVTTSEAANDRLTVQGLGGDDAITATTLPAGVIQLTIDGGAGNDTILGSQGADTLIGGDGNDFIFGDNGNDTALMGEGDDIFQWNPGDGNDTIDGGNGSDRLLFFGANIAENVSIVANGDHAVLSRDVANVNMDMDGVEAIEFRALGGIDNITVGDLSATDVTRVDIDMRGPNGGGDGSADSVTVNATQGADVFGVRGDDGGVNVFGLHAEVNMFFTDDGDRLTLNGQGGDDVIDASGLEAGAVQLTINGGLGNDLMIGSEGDDLINGGDGNDVAFMGLGNDTFVWNPGDDNDTVDGQGGFDTMQFNGANIAENVNIFANGDHAVLSRDVANVVMDLDGVEAVNFQARDGTDTITVNDMSGTDVTEVNIDLSEAPGGGGDGDVDTVIINATSGDDVVVVTGANGQLSILGLATQINILNFEAQDRLIINTLDGDDVIEGSSLGAGIPFTGNGGNGDDVLIGGAGADILNGDAGDDVLIGGLGQDILNGGVGDNILIQ